MPMPTSDYRLVDQQITNIVWDTKEPDDGALILAPTVEITRANNTYLKFSDDDFLVIDDHREPGGIILDAEIGYEGGTVELKQFARNAKVSFEDYEASLAAQKVKLRIRSVKKVVNLIQRSAIKKVAAMASNPNNYATANKEVSLTGTDLFDDPDSNPDTIGDDAKEAIRRGIGIYPNALLIAAGVKRHLRRHPKVLDYFKHNGGVPVNDAQLAEFFGVEKILNGGGVYKSRATGATTDMWDNSMVFAYVPPQVLNNPNPTIKSSGGDDGEPAFMYTFRGMGHPKIEMEYEHRETRSWKTPVFLDYDPKMVGPSAGFLIQPCIA